MKYPKTLVAGSLFLLVVFSFSLPSGYVNAANEQAPKPALGKEAPLFASKTVDNKELDLKTLRNDHLTLLVFWATWCGPCRAEIPHLQEAYKAFNQKGLKIVSVNVSDEYSNLQKFLKEKEMPWTHVYDKEMKVASKYHVKTIPAMFLIDHEGKIVAMNDQLRGKEFMSVIESYLKKLPKA